MARTHLVAKGAKRMGHPRGEADLLGCAQGRLFDCALARSEKKRGSKKKQASDPRLTSSNRERQAVWGTVDVLNPA